MDRDIVSCSENLSRICMQAKAKSQDTEPFSWWSSRVKSIRGEVCVIFVMVCCLSTCVTVSIVSFGAPSQFYLISYTDWGDTYNEIVEKDVLRPMNPKYVCS